MLSISPSGVPVQRINMPKYSRGYVELIAKRSAGPGDGHAVVLVEVLVLQGNVGIVHVQS